MIIKYSVSQMVFEQPIIRFCFFKSMYHRLEKTDKLKTAIKKKKFHFIIELKMAFIIGII